MWSVEEVFVLSDLHLAAERGTGLFQSDVELTGCLRWILTDCRDSVIVLAGDILDFLVSTGGSTIGDFSNVVEHTKRILDQHAEVCDALSELARSSRHKLVVMGGNHDPELVFQDVQETVERRLGLDFGDAAICWLVHGEALRLRVGDAVVLIEHGNVLDPWNRINHAELQGAFSLASRNLADSSDYEPPPGSRLVMNVINELRERRSWIDCLKPETEAVLPLLWHFAEGMQRKHIFSLADEYLSIKAFALNRKISNSHYPERLYKGDREAESSENDEAFKEWVGATYEQQRLTLGVKKKEDSKLVEKLRLVSARDTFFDLDQPDGSETYLGPIFQGGADLVIHGHTHSAKAYAVEGGFYINTGTWGQLLRLPKSYENDQVWESFLAQLQANDIGSFRRPTFARVRRQPKQNATTAALLEWQHPSPKTLAARRFSDPQTGWRREE